MRCIHTYFSHSYRPENRSANKAIWERFAKRGFYFTVDPPTELTTHTHLETMMLRSSCFVAVVNYRIENPPYFCSHFILAEFGLAVQSKTPKLILVDENVPARFFDKLPPEEYLKLDFDHPEDWPESLDQRIKQLSKRALSHADRPARPRNRLGLLVVANGRTKAYGGERVRNDIARCAELYGMTCEEEPVPAQHNALFAMGLDKYECVVMDVRGDYLPTWVFAYVYGRFVPTIKLVRAQRRELISTIPLAPLVKGLRMDPDEPGVESLIYWRDTADLTLQLSKTLKRVKRRGTELRKPAEGLTYFDSLGRPPARLFVSNAGSANDFADKLCSILERNNIEAWQYKQPGAITTGTSWPKTIKRELDQCDLFVALLDQDYPNSDWCRREMRRARQRAAEGTVSLLPFQIDSKLSGTEIEELIGDLQAAPVYRSRNKACQHVFEEIDKTLRRAHGDENWRLRQPLLLGASREAIIDALRHLPRSKYPKLLQHLDNERVAVSVEPAKRTIQPRHVAEGVLRDVQQCTKSMAGHQYTSTTSVLVAVLTRLVEVKRKKVLEALLQRMEAKMKRRLG